MCFGRVGDAASALGAAEAEAAAVADAFGADEATAGLADGLPVGAGGSSHARRGTKHRIAEILSIRISRCSFFSPVDATPAGRLISRALRS
jgi:hypothetical protein